mmetsp:Transcript_750/g.1622  ORF Transcript_750/g.1622 Transcript_750/m.1622 type:complete len:233 (+) Transcript_750:1775-2473(+)
MAATKPLASSSMWSSFKCASNASRQARFEDAFPRCSTCCAAGFCECPGVSFGVDLEAPCRKFLSIWPLIFMRSSSVVGEISEGPLRAPSTTARRRRTISGCPLTMALAEVSHDNRTKAFAFLSSPPKHFSLFARSFWCTFRAKPPRPTACMRVAASSSVSETRTLRTFFLPVASLLEAFRNSITAVMSACVPWATAASTVDSTRAAMPDHTRSSNCAPTFSIQACDGSASAK